jgi:hypothetical protein
MWACSSGRRLPAAQRAEALTIEGMLAGEPSRCLTFGNSAQQQHDGCWPLAGLFEHYAGQDSVGALTLVAAIDREMLLLAEQPAVRALAAWVDKAGRMEILLKPRSTRSIIKQVGQGKVYHAG